MEPKKQSSIEPFRPAHGASKIVSELMNLGGAEWAIDTTSQSPRFANPSQELLREKLRRRTRLLHKNLI